VRLLTAIQACMASVNDRYFTMAGDCGWMTGCSEVKASCGFVQRNAHPVSA
jgi:hypothetical protein